MRLCICTRDCRSVGPSVCLSVWPSIHLTSRQSICRSVHRSVRQSVRPSIYPVLLSSNFSFDFEISGPFPALFRHFCWTKSSFIRQIHQYRSFLVILSGLRALCLNLLLFCKRFSFKKNLWSPWLCGRWAWFGVDNLGHMQTTFPFGGDILYM